MLECCQALLGVGQVTEIDHAHSKYLQKKVSISFGKYDHTSFFPLHDFSAPWNKERVIFFYVCNFIVEYNHTLSFKENRQ